MSNFAEQAVPIKNVNSPFTELFSLLTKYEILPDNTLRLAYARDELNIMRHHIFNASEIILQGLQEIGGLFAAFDREKLNGVPAENIGNFMAITCNLLEAMNRINIDLG